MGFFYTKTMEERRPSLIMGITKLTLAPQLKQQLNLHLVQQMKLLQL